MEKSKSIISPWLWTAIVVIILIVAGYFVWAMWNKNQSLPVATSTIEPTADITTPIASPSASASPISTADWKTYTNSQYGFSFKYPADWVVDSNNSNNVLLALALKSPEPPDGTPIDMAVSINKSYKELDVQHLGVSSLKDYFDKYTTSRTNGDGIPSYSSVIPVIFSNQNGYKAVLSNGLGKGEYSLFTTLNNGNILEVFDISQNINARYIEDTFQLTK